jgi:hypothetical protein
MTRIGMNVNEQKIQEQEREKDHNIAGRPFVFPARMELQPTSGG